MKAKYYESDNHIIDLSKVSAVVFQSPDNHLDDKGLFIDVHLIGGGTVSIYHDNPDYDRFLASYKAYRRPRRFFVDNPVRGD
jgi:hypothetical protein